MGMFDRRSGFESALSQKAPCRLSTTTNITLNGMQAVDGVTPTSTQHPLLRRVLVKNQSDAAENGIWLMGLGPWVRAADFNGVRDFCEGTRVFVFDGATQSGSYLVTTSVDPETFEIDEDDINFSEVDALDIGLASESTSGAVELATAAETITGTSTALATHPAGVAAAIAGALEPLDVITFATKAAAEAFDPDGTAPDVIRTNGYTAAGDGGGALYKQVASEPAHEGKIEIADGTWYEYVTDAEGIDARAFGYKADWSGTDSGATDNSTPLQNCINYATREFGTGFDTGGGGGNIILLPSGSALFGSNVIIHDGVNVIGKGTYGTVLKMATAFSGSTHMFRVGTPGDVAAICALQTRSGAGNLTINGTLASGGTVTFLQKRIVSVYSVGNNSGITFTITGTDETGASISDVLTGPNNSRTDSVEYFKTITQVATSNTVTGNITVGHQDRASFGSLLENCQLFSTNVNASSGVAMVYTNNAQHSGGARRLKIFGGNRVCLYMETGTGGASDITIEHIETFNLGNSAGVTANNMQVRCDYKGLTVTMSHILCQGPGASGGAAAKGLYLDGGFLFLQHFHTEGVATGIFNALANVNDGALRMLTANGSSGTTKLLHIDSTVDADTTVVGHTFANGSTTTVQDDTPAGAGAVTGNIIADTIY